MRKYSRVSYEIRCQIDAFLQVKLSIPEIANMLGLHKSTIYREIKRNSIYGLYSPGTANKKSKDRYKQCRRKHKLTPEIQLKIENLLKNGWSPEQISGRLRIEFGDGPSHTTIYKFIYGKEKRRRGLKIYLRRFNKRGAGRYIQRRRFSKNGTSIHQRPKVANNRSRIGDWERDTMYTKNNVYVLVCTDRKSRFTKLSILRERNCKAVDKATNELLESTGRKSFTMTNDNGPDFKASKDLSVVTYFCDPMKPQQRGTVENTIGLLRQYIKRKTDIRTIKNLKYYEDKINNRPRKVLNYKTPYEVYYNKKVALVS